MKYKLINADEIPNEILAKMVDIDNHIPLEYDDKFTLSNELTEERLKRYHRAIKEGFLKAIFYNEELVGFHICCKLSPKVGRILSLWVHPDHRSKGLAKTLKSEGIRWARSQKLRKLYTKVPPKNQRMLEINQKNKFEVTGIELCVRI